MPLSVFPDKVFASNKLNGNNCGRKKKHNRAALAALTLNIPLSERGTYSNLAANLEISRSTAWRLQRDGFKPVTSSLKPGLNEEH